MSSNACALRTSKSLILLLRSRRAGRRGLLQTNPKKIVGPSRGSLGFGIRCRAGLDDSDHAERARRQRSSNLQGVLVRSQSSKLRLGIVGSESTPA